MYDEETNIHPLVHAMFNMMIIIEKDYEEAEINE